MSQNNHSLDDFNTDSQPTSTNNEEQKQQDTSTNKPKSQQDITNDNRSSEQEPNAESENNEPAADTETDDGTEEHMCPRFEEERATEEWQELLSELPLKEPKCGYAINYLRSEGNATIGESTTRTYCSSLRMFVDFLHDRETRVCDAELKDVKAFFDMRAKNNRRKKTLSLDKTAITNLFKHIDLYCDVEPDVKWGLIREEIDPSRYNSIPDPIEREPLKKEEIKKIYHAIDSFRNRLIVQVGVELGPRNTDISRIKLDDVHLEEQRITLSNTKAGGEYTLPISDELTLLLRQWIEVEHPNHTGAGESEYLFPSRDGGRIGQNRLNDIVKNAAEKAGVQETLDTRPLTETQQDILDTDKEEAEIHKVTAHALRHTFNYLLQEAGVPREARSDALDHSNTGITKDFYDHQESDYREFVANCFNTLNTEDTDDDDDDEAATPVTLN